MSNATRGIPLFDEDLSPEDKACRERAVACHHRWSHYPPNPTMAVPRPYCLKCGIDVDNMLSAVWQHGYRGGAVN